MFRGQNQNLAIPPSFPHKTVATMTMNEAAEIKFDKKFSLGSSHQISDLESLGAGCRITEHP